MYLLLVKLRQFLSLNVPSSCQAVLDGQMGGFFCAGKSLDPLTPPPRVVKDKTGSERALALL